MSRRIVLLIDDEQLDYKIEATILKEEDINLIPICSDSQYLIAAALSDDIVGLIVRASIEIDKELISMLPFLKIIFVTGAGFNKVNIDAATKQGVAVAYAGDYCAQEVAEHVIAMLLSLEKNIVWYDSKVRKGFWKVTPPYPTERIMGKTIGIIGMGHIGRALTKLSIGIGMKVLAHDPYVEDSVLNKLGANSCSLEKILPSSDYISANIPLTKKTENMFSTSLFSKMKPGVIFINTGRGPVVDEVALFNAVTSGHIRAVGLDVFQKEPPTPDNPLFSLENVIVSPHIGYQSIESVQEVKRRSVKDIINVLKGKRPVFLANPEIWG